MRYVVEDQPVSAAVNGTIRTVLSFTTDWTIAAEKCEPKEA